jgi:class 3 adenylate cyclase
MSASAAAQRKVTPAAPVGSPSGLTVRPPGGGARIGQGGRHRRRVVMIARSERRSRRASKCGLAAWRFYAVDVDEVDPLNDIAALGPEARDRADSLSHSSGPLLTIAFFDLSGSTSSTLQRGNAKAARTALTFTSLAELVARRFGGDVVKTLGDGALVSFDDPLAAIRAALNLRYAAMEMDIDMTAGLTLGRPIRVDLGDGRYDLLGDVVNRAARVQSLALPGQVLIDETLRTAVQADLNAQPGWEVDGQPRKSFAKGIGSLSVYEVALREHWRLRRQLATPYFVDASGRPSFAEKVAILQGARSEIIEIGIGLTSFARYFTEERPEQFRDPLREHIKRGVNLRCFMADPEYRPAAAWIEEQGDQDYPAGAAAARRILENEARLYKREHYGGRLHVYTYRRIPEFWCLGVDVDDEREGRMFYASYILGRRRSENPVTQVSRSSNPELYEVFHSSIEAIRNASTERQ